MDITYLGHSSFRLKGKNAVVVTDPFDPSMVGLKYPKVEADIVTVSHNHKDHNMSSLVKNVKITIDGPGEYEVMGVSVIGIGAYHDDKKGKLRGKNTIYVIEIDNLRVVHLGDLGHILSEKYFDLIGHVDVLLIPVGGEYTIGPTQAVQIARDIEPSISIPMHYKTAGMDKKIFGKLSDLKPFLSDVGFAVERTTKLSVKKESLGEEKKVVVLERR